MSVDYRQYELTSEQMAFEDKITKEFEMALNHGPEDAIYNNGWV